MPSCFIRHCKNYICKKSTKHVDVTFHAFPKDQSVKVKWIKSTGHDEDWYPPPNRVICSAHFEEKCFTEKNGRRYLKRGSVPTLKLTYDSCSSVEKNKSVEINSNDAGECSLTQLRREKEYYRNLVAKQKRAMNTKNQKYGRLLKKMDTMQKLLDTLQNEYDLADVIKSAKKSILDKDCPKAKVACKKENLSKAENSLAREEIYLSEAENSLPREENLSIKREISLPHEEIRSIKVENSLPREEICSFKTENRFPQEENVSVKQESGLDKNETLLVLVDQDRIVCKVEKNDSD